MSDYRAPLADLRFVLRELVGLDEIAALPGFEDVDADDVDAVLEEAGRFAADVLAPLHRSADREGARLTPDGVVTPAGFVDAYRRFVDGGWNSLEGAPAWGGQGLPRALGVAVRELWASANLAFSLVLPLNDGAAHALSLAGSEAQQRRFLPKLTRGQWTGAMDLTEPQAGSDLSLVRTRALPQADGSHRLFGQKIFITYGEHDLAPNIVHLVLARLPDAPPGTRGLSLFVVPRFLPRADGTPGERNDLRCVSLEHKLGIHGSPTCVMAFGDRDGAVGELVGTPNRGLETMFLMMNSARLATGLQGVAIGERAYQQALAYARGRVQGRSLDVGARAGAVPIVEHADVRRMLLSMRAQTEAMRALCGVVAADCDRAARHPDAATRAAAQARVDLLTPVVKGWCTETGVEVASTGLQVHGGTGYVEETGAAQLLRDARIIPIYEGTTGIQANDLAARKIARDGGAAIGTLLATMRADVARLAAAEGADARAIVAATTAGLDALERCVAFVVATNDADPQRVAAGAVPLLKLTGTLAGGWQLARAAAICAARIARQDGDVAFARRKLATARFYADHVLMPATALAHAVIHGGDAVLGVASDEL